MGPQATQPRHLADLFSDDAALVARVSAYLGEALTAGGTAIAVCTASHRGPLLDALAGCGRGKPGRLIVLDAKEALEDLTVDQRIDPTRFDQVIGALVDHHARADGPLRVFGEIVDLLWRGGRVDAVMALEGLWNDLLLRVDFELYCAYESQLAGDAAGDQVLALHTAVVGVPEARRSRRFAAVPGAVGQARRFVRAALTGCPEALVADVMVATSELAGNAVVHGGSDFEVTVARRGGRICVSVADEGPDWPRLRPVDANAESGRGLRLVNAVATRWGVDGQPPDKAVWAEFDSASSH
jgi:anti-sigma regulatory factor (Ser/Thr protein kinase)